MATVTFAPNYSLSRNFYDYFLSLADSQRDEMEDSGVGGYSRASPREGKNVPPQGDVFRRSSPRPKPPHQTRGYKNQTPKEEAARRRSSNLFFKTKATVCQSRAQKVENPAAVEKPRQRSFHAESLQGRGWRPRNSDDFQCLCRVVEGFNIWCKLSLVSDVALTNEMRLEKTCTQAQRPAGRFGPRALSCTACHRNN